MLTVGRLKLRNEIKLKTDLKSVDGRLVLQGHIQDGLADVVLVVLEIGEDCLIQGDPEIRQILFGEVGWSRNVEVRVKAVDVTANRVSLKTDHSFTLT